eukprot:6489416-Amphidinium_carterae.1
MVLLAKFILTAPENSRSLVSNNYMKQLLTCGEANGELGMQKLFLDGMPQWGLWSLETFDGDEEQRENGETVHPTNV